VRRRDPDNRSIEDDRLISEHRWGLWQKPAGDEQQCCKRASDEDKIADYRQRSSLLKIEQFQFAFRTHPKKLNVSLDSHLLARRRRCNVETGLTLVTNAAKHKTPMANVARLNALLISAPVPFPFRADAAPQRSTPLP
jgi:hypothetical protein